jgi:hypothetical protein
VNSVVCTYTFSPALAVMALTSIHGELWKECNKMYQNLLEFWKIKNETSKVRVMIH